MNDDLIRAEISKEIEPLPGIRAAHPHPVKWVGGVPGSVAGYPERIEYGILAQGRADRLTLPLTVVVGGVIERETSKASAAYAGRGDPRSVIDALESKDDWENCSYVTVVDAVYEVITHAGVDYLSVTFELDVAVSN